MGSSPFRGKLTAWKVLLFIFAALLLSSCITLRDPEAAQEYTGDIVATLTPDTSVGQTFVSRRPRLNTIQLWLKIEGEMPQNGGLHLRLFHSPLDSRPLYETMLPYTDIANSFPLTVKFPTQADSPGQAYFLLLEGNVGAIQVFGRVEDSYPQGQLLVDGMPSDVDLAFALSYDYDLLAFSADFGAALRNAWLILPLLLTLWLPGNLLFKIIAHLKRSSTGAFQTLDMGERLALSIGLSMAIIPLVMLWTTVMGLCWQRSSVLVVAGLLVVVWLWLTWRTIPHESSFKGWLMHQDKTGWVLLVVFLFVLATRLVMVRDLAAPPWVDSVHHALITRLVMENGGFPSSYEPFLQTSTANYHTGFHSLLAVFIWLSGLALPDAMLFFGQFLNALCVYAVYLFTKNFTGDRLTGVFAALISGLFSPMPAYYTSWGRYTQLAGLVMLPACLMLLMKYLESSDRRVFFLAALSFSGLLLTHYRVAAFLGCLILALLLERIVQAVRRHTWRQAVPTVIARLVGFGAFSLILSLPWWPSTITSLLIPHAGEAGVSITPFFDFSWGYLTSAYGKQVLYLAGLGLLLAILQRRWFPSTLAIWVALLFLLANLGALRLPGYGFVNNTAVEISLFIPLSLLAGYVLGELIHAWEKTIAGRRHWVLYSLAGVTAVVVCLMGARKLITILNPITFLFRQADRPAIAWVQEHIPSDEAILINPFLWGYGLYAGNDGGFWISPLAGRRTMPPPVLAALGQPVENQQAVSELCQQVIDMGKDADALYHLLQSQGIHYVYLGVRGGAISAKALQDSSLFQLIYDQDGVRVFELLPQGENP